MLLLAWSLSAAAVDQPKHPGGPPAAARFAHTLDTKLADKAQSLQTSDPQRAQAPDLPIVGTVTRIDGSGMRTPSCRIARKASFHCRPKWML